MHRTESVLPRLAAGALLACAVACAPPPDPAATAWPQYRGQDRDGVATGVPASPRIPAGDAAVRWRRELGSGFSQIVSDGEALVTGASDETNETVVRLDPATGETVWTTPIGEAFDDMFGRGPRSTPTIHEGRVYMLSARGRVSALDLATGDPLWEVELTERFGSRVPRFGYGGQPLVVGDRLVVDSGASRPGEGDDPETFEARGGLVALALADGATLWETRDGGASYSSPVLVDLEGGPHLATARGQELVGYGTGGERLWAYGISDFGAIAMPIALDNGRVFVSGQGDGIGAVVEIVQADDGFEAREIWRSTTMRNHFNSSVVRGDVLFGFDNAELKAIGLADGNELWSMRGFGKGSLALVGDALAVLSDQGRLALVEASGDTYRELASLDALEGKSWTAPSAATGAILLRNLDEATAIEIEEGPR